MAQENNRKTTFLTWKKYFITGWILFAAGVLFCTFCYLALLLPPVPDRTFFPPTVNPAPEATSFRVALFSDNGMYEKPLDAFSADIKQKKADFIICDGDFIPPATHAMAGLVSQQFSRLFPIPLYATPGNHDVDNFEKQIAFSSIFGPPDNFFAYGDTLFIMLESAKGNISEKQIKWMESVLKTERPRYRRCVIVTHIPPVAPAPFNSWKYHWDEPTAERFRKGIENKKIDLILCGHVHCFMKIPFGDTHIIICPASGQKPRDKSNMRYGYVLLDFKADGLISEEPRFFPRKRSRKEVYTFIFRKMNMRGRAFAAGLACMAAGMILILAGMRKKYRQSVPDHTTNPT